jgi:hypothetical protein
VKLKYLLIGAGFVLMAAMPGPAETRRVPGELNPATLKSWHGYIDAAESRMAAELKSGAGFLALDFQERNEAARERRNVLAGEILIRKMESFAPAGGRIPIIDGTIHHWRGSIFIPGATMDLVLSRVIDPNQEELRQEDVLQSQVLERGPDSLKIFLRLQRSKYITAVYDTEHSVRVTRFGKSRAASVSIATRITELDASTLRPRPAGEDRGFLWRLNSYWRYEQVANGVIVECESISLSRSVPSFLEPILRPLIDSAARESMQRTLESMRARLKRT